MESESERTIAEDTQRGDRGDIPGSTVHPAANAVGTQPPTGIRGDEEAVDRPGEYDDSERPDQRTQRTDAEDTERGDGIPDGDSVGPGERAVPGSVEVSRDTDSGERSGDAADESVRADTVVDSDPDGLELPIY